MKTTSILAPLFRTIDKLLLGIDEFHEIEREPETIQCDNEEEFDVLRSEN